MIFSSLPCQATLVDSHSIFAVFVNYRPVAEVAEATLETVLQTADGMLELQQIDEEGNSTVADETSVRRESLTALLQKHGKPCVHVCVFCTIVANKSHRHPRRGLYQARTG